MEGAEAAMARTVRIGEWQLCNMMEIVRCGGTVAIGNVYVI